MGFIPCTMSPGAFSGEIAFEISLANGGKHLGLASRRYFWTDERTPLGNKPLASATEGIVRARILDEVEGGTVLLSIPDGEVVPVKRDIILHSERESNVPIGS